MNENSQKNETLNVIKNRRSIRAYNQKPLTQVEIDTIILGAMRAPTAGNLMMYSIIHVADQNLKDKLVKTCDNQPHSRKPCKGIRRENKEASSRRVYS